MPDVSPQWHAVRPWSPRFLLTVREITSVSTTFVLSSTCSADGVDAGLASLGIASGLGSDDEDTLEDAPGASQLGMSKLSLVSDALGRGFSVNVNGAAWKRVLMRMDEKGDEAVLVLYGLMPGRQYDVELGIVFGDGEEILHSRMVTQPQPGQTGSDDVGDSSIDSSSSSITTVSSISSATSSAITPLQRTITLDEYASQLRAQLSHLNSERDSLSAQLKAARKEAHKADAAKRNEIDALKRAAEKHAAAETRGRQKTRALQEAAKQATAAARDAEDSARELEASLPSLRARADAAATQHASVAAEAARTQDEADDALRTDRARTEALRSELAALTARLEKLQAKRARLSRDALPGLEAQLAGLVREVELVARDAGAFEVIDNGPVSFDLGAGGQQYAPGRTAGGGPVAFANSTSTTPMNSPPASIGRQAAQGGSKSPYNSNVNGSLTLSSRAPPFDPGPAFGARLGPALQLQSNGPRRLPPSLQLPSAHSHAQSLDVGASGLVSETSSAGIGRRPVSPSPTRQTSLPIRMPSQTNLR